VPSTTTGSSRSLPFSKSLAIGHPAPDSPFSRMTQSPTTTRSEHGTASADFLRRADGLDVVRMRKEQVGFGATAGRPSDPRAKSAGVSHCLSAMSSPAATSEPTTGRPRLLALGPCPDICGLSAGGQRPSPLSRSGVRAEGAAGMSPTAALRGRRVVVSRSVACLESANLPRAVGDRRVSQPAFGGTSLGDWR
jgi:hypothetical protein